MKIIYKRFSQIIVALVMFSSAFVFGGCSWKASYFSEEEHIQRIRERAEKSYLGEGSEYTGLEVYPIYNEYDKLRYALIEFEPQGFIYVSINDQAYSWRGMYTRSATEPENWMPYRVKEGENEVDITDENGYVTGYINREFFRDENGQVIIYNESHFKVAGIENERRYLLSTVLTVYVGYTHGLIPAVKRGEQYLDLVDEAMIDYTPGMESAYAVADIGFINKDNFDL